MKAKLLIMAHKTSWSCFCHLFCILFFPSCILCSGHTQLLVNSQWVILFYPFNFPYVVSYNQIIFPIFHPIYLHIPTYILKTVNPHFLQKVFLLDYPLKRLEKATSLLPHFVLCIFIQPPPPPPPPTSSSCSCSSFCSSSSSCSSWFSCSFSFSPSSYSSFLCSFSSFFKLSPLSNYSFVIELPNIYWMPPMYQKLSWVLDI